jgi:hypothetical protein
MGADDMTGRLACPECGSHEVVCIPHPTYRGWHEYECEDCGFQGGEHKSNVATTMGTESMTRWREPG